MKKKLLTDLDSLINTKIYTENVNVVMVEVVDVGDINWFYIIQQ